MIIKGKYDTYKVTWRQDGWSWAVPVIRARRRFLFVFTIWRKVWTAETHSKTIISAENLYPDAMRNWFQEAVAHYECYIEAWEKEESDATYKRMQES